MIKRVIKNFTCNFKSFMIFEIIYKVLCGFIFVPINYKILNFFMDDIGIYNIKNKDLLRLSLTPEGVLYLFIVLVISFIAVFIEIGILTYISYKSHENSKASILEGAINIFSIFPKNLSIYMVCLVLISGVVGPLTGIGLYSSLITRLTIPTFIKVALFKSNVGIFVYYGLLLLLIIFLVKWLLAIPIMIMEDVTFKEAFSNSSKIYKKKKFKIIMSIVIWTLINYLLRIIALGGVAILFTAILKKVEAYYLISQGLVIIGILAFFIIYVIISLITLPLFIAFLVELYFKNVTYEPSNRIFLSVEFYSHNKLCIWILNNKKNIITATIAAFILVSGIIGFSAVYNDVLDRDVEITAHRGSSKKAPENSLSAINLAIAEEADYVEIDVQISSDGEVVLFHDSTLKRMAGVNKSINNMTLKEIRTVDIGSGFSEAFKGEKIPTLEEVLITVKDRVKLNIELKTRRNNDDLPEKLVELIEKYDMEDQVIISSQNYVALERVKKLNPLLNVGYILTFGVGDFSKLNIDFVSVDNSMLKKEFVNEMHILGKEVHVWTINDKRKAENAIKLGADNIITDSVENIKSASEKIKDTEDINYLSRFYDCISSIIRYVKI